MPDMTAIVLVGAGVVVIPAAILSAIPGARRAFAAIPLTLLIGLNVFRMGGLLFVLLAFAGKMSGPFPYVAGVGDFVTGAWAIPVAWSVARDVRLRHRAVLAWNAFGTVDLIVAIALTLASGNGPLQFFIAAVGAAGTQSPLSLIPIALVTLFLVIHMAIFLRIGVRRRLVVVDALAHPH